MEIYHHSSYGLIFEQNRKSIPVLKPTNEKYILPDIRYGGDVDLSDFSLCDLEKD